MYLNTLSINCIPHCIHYIKLNFIAVWDASAKAPVGLVSGSRFQLGDYDECLSIQTPLEAQYCLVDVKIHVPPGHNTTDPFAIEYDPNTSLWDKMYVSTPHPTVLILHNYILNNPLNFFFFSIKVQIESVS